MHFPFYKQLLRMVPGFTGPTRIVLRMLKHSTEQNYTKAQTTLTWRRGPWDSQSPCISGRKRPIRAPCVGVWWPPSSLLPSLRAQKELSRSSCTNSATTCSADLQAGALLLAQRLRRTWSFCAFIMHFRCMTVMLGDVRINLTPRPFVYRATLISRFKF